MKRNESGQVGAVFLGLFLFLVVFVGAPLAAWRLGWIFAQKNADFQAHVIRHGYSNQTTLRDDLTRKIGDTNTITVQIAQVGNTNPELAGSLRAQRFAVASIVCREANQVTGDALPPEQQQFVQANCLAGSVSPSSSFNS